MATRILLVEDDPAIVEALSELLAGEGYAVDHAATQERAIELSLGKGAALPGHAASTEAPYQLVLLDVTLAQGNGFAVCAAIKQATPQVPVIFLTASDDEFNTVTGIQMGADDYVAKPFRPRELLASPPPSAARSRSDTSSPSDRCASTPIAPGLSALVKNLLSRPLSIGCFCCLRPTRASSSRAIASATRFGTMPAPISKRTRCLYISSACATRLKTTLPTPPSSRRCAAWAIRREASHGTQPRL